MTEHPAEYSLRNYITNKTHQCKHSNMVRNQKWMYLFQSYGVGCTDGNCMASVKSKWNEPEGFSKEPSKEEIIKEATQFLREYYASSKLANEKLESRILEVTELVRYNVKDKSY